MPRILNTKEDVSFKESLQSLKYIPRFFKEIKSVNPKLFYTNIVLRLISSLLPLAILWVGKAIIDEVMAQISATEKIYHNLILYVVAELALMLLSDLVNRLMSLYEALLGDQYSIRSSITIIKKTSTVSLSQLEDADFYDKLERARQQTKGRVNLMTNILGQAEDLIVIVSLLLGMVYFEPWLIILLIVSVVPTIINELKFSGTSYSLIRSWTEERRELDYLTFIGASDATAKEVKLFGLSDYIANRYEELSIKYYLENRRLAISRTSWGSIYNFLGTLAYYAAYGIIVYRTVIQIFSLGDMTFLSGAFTRLSSRLKAFIVRFTAITESALYLQDYFDFIDISTNLSAPTENIPMPPKPKLGFEFVHVGFKYPDTEKWVIEDISFTLKAGEKLALVGENGAGKTTLIKLLLRFYEPTTGQILLDGIPIDQYNHKAYQEYFGVIFQDFVKFELTVKENIAVGSIDDINDLNKIDAAAEKSLADDVIKNLPKGYDQKLGKRFTSGKQLSGGQWQKIAIARAYMKNAEVLILDEPTSALDARAEAEAFDRFIKLTEGKTAIIISHRFSTVRIADRILVLKDGRILELGTHEELMAHDNLYAELFNLQAQGYL